MDAIWKTLKQIEQDYEIKADSLKVYINIGKVPKYHAKKRGRYWYINENWIKKNFKPKE